MAEHDDTAALDRAIQEAGSVRALADKIGVAASAPSMWRARGRVPAEHCPAIELATGVLCEQLRPDVRWDVLRAKRPAKPAANDASKQKERAA